MSTECNEDDIAADVASLFTNVFFQPPYVREKKVVM
jgi:hypothetical protein